MPAPVRMGENVREPAPAIKPTDRSDQKGRMFAEGVQPAAEEGLRRWVRTSVTAHIMTD